MDNLHNNKLQRQNRNDIGMPQSITVYQYQVHTGLKGYQIEYVSSSDVLYVTDVCNVDWHNTGPAVGIQGALCLQAGWHHSSHVSQTKPAAENWHGYWEDVNIRALFFISASLPTNAESSKKETEDGSGDQCIGVYPSILNVSPASDDTLHFLDISVERWLQSYTICHQQVSQYQDGECFHNRVRVALFLNRIILSFFCC